MVTSDQAPCSSTFDGGHQGGARAGDPGVGGVRRHGRHPRTVGTSRFALHFSKCKAERVLNVPPPPTTAPPAGRQRWSRFVPALRETALVLVLFGLYNLGRMVATGRLDGADDHARSPSISSGHCGCRRRRRSRRGARRTPPGQARPTAATCCTSRSRSASWSGSTCATAPATRGRAARWCSPPPSRHGAAHLAADDLALAARRPRHGRHRPRRRQQRVLSAPRSPSSRTSTPPCPACTSAGPCCWPSSVVTVCRNRWRWLWVLHLSPTAGGRGDGEPLLAGRRRRHRAGRRCAGAGRAGRPGGRAAKAEPAPAPGGRAAKDES